MTGRATGLWLTLAVALSTPAHGQDDGRPLSLGSERTRQQAVQQLVDYSLLPLVDQQLDRLVQNGLAGSELHRDLGGVADRLRDLTAEDVPEVLHQIELAAAAAPGAEAEAAVEAVRSRSRRLVLALLAERERLRRQRTRLDVAVSLQNVAAQLDGVRATMRSADLTAVRAAELAATLDRVAELYESLARGVEERSLQTAGHEAEVIRTAVTVPAIGDAIRRARAELLTGRSRSAAAELRLASAEIERALDRVAPGRAASQAGRTAATLTALAEIQRGLIGRAAAARGHVDWGEIASTQQTVTDRLSPLGADLVTARQASSRAALHAFREEREATIAAQREALRSIDAAIASLQRERSTAVPATEAASASRQIGDARSLLDQAWGHAVQGKPLPELGDAVSGLTRGAGGLRGEAASRAQVAAASARDAEQLRRRHARSEGGGDELGSAVAMAAAAATEADHAAAAVSGGLTIAEDVVRVSITDAIAGVLRAAARGAEAGAVSTEAAAATVARCVEVWSGVAEDDESASGAADALVAARDGWRLAASEEKEDSAQSAAAEATLVAADRVEAFGDGLAEGLRGADAHESLRVRVERLASLASRLDRVGALDADAVPKAMPKTGEVIPAGRDATVAWSRVLGLLADGDEGPALRGAIQRTAVLVELERQRAASAAERLARLERSAGAWAAAREALRQRGGDAAGVHVRRYTAEMAAMRAVADEMFEGWQIADPELRSAADTAASIVDAPWLAWATRVDDADRAPGLTPWPATAAARLMAGRDATGSRRSDPDEEQPGGTRPADEPPGSAGDEGGADDGDALSSWDASLPAAIRREMRRDRSEGVPELYQDRLRRYYESLE